MGELKSVENCELGLLKEWAEWWIMVKEMNFICSISGFISKKRGIFDVRKLKVESKGNNFELF